jgi:hypothetical protein
LQSFQTENDVPNDLEIRKYEQVHLTVSRKRGPFILLKNNEEREIVIKRVLFNITDRDSRVSQPVSQLER